MFLAGTTVADDDARQAVFALQPEEMAGIGEVAEDQCTRLVRHDLAPVLLARLLRRRFHDLEILSVAVIGEDVEGVAALGDLIFDLGFALGYDLRLGGEVRGRDDAIFAGFVVVDVDEDVVVEQ